MDKTVKALLAVLLVLVIIVVIVQDVDANGNHQASGGGKGPGLTINTGSAGGDVVFNGTLPLTADQVYRYNFTLNPSSDKIVMALEDNSTASVYCRLFYPNNTVRDSFTVSPGISIDSVFPYGQSFTSGVWYIKLITNQGLELRFKLTVFYS
ncbi:hypothetical protein GCM10007108_14730 [Thermogymnomonas acidicola]|uniref:Uncharacterized protein n=1 Tax=Thermogymnomonas acidicola TaxID=399579 RepID=A0AA37BSI2_9ARCH|nr:hypothetical protein [Thermogymnomonas acidicola]GGM77653.1 hypothetical protein GCM10007108_14730 [Thermogymnomonas acidicola]